MQLPFQEGDEREEDGVMYRQEVPYSRWIILECDEELDQLVSSGASHQIASIGLVELDQGSEFALEVFVVHIDGAPQIVIPFQCLQDGLVANLSYSRVLPNIQRREEGVGRQRVGYRLALRIVQIHGAQTEVLQRRRYLAQIPQGVVRDDRADDCLCRWGGWRRRGLFCPFRRRRHHGYCQGPEVGHLGAGFDERVQVVGVRRLQVQPRHPHFLQRIGHVGAAEDLRQVVDLFLRAQLQPLHVQVAQVGCLGQGLQEAARLDAARVLAGHVAVRKYERLERFQVADHVEQLLLLLGVLGGRDRRGAVVVVGAGAHAEELVPHLHALDAPVVRQHGQQAVQEAVVGGRVAQGLVDEEVQRVQAVFIDAIDEAVHSRLCGVGVNGGSVNVNVYARVRLLE
mmetsp:Transcript_13893/g.39528  ORF Transcript_13893/g.39528 Transcript_13893/m.39528 type:complete len:398 (-) Transcript_13893:298-1491(-)